MALISHTPSVGRRKSFSIVSADDADREVAASVVSTTAMVSRCPTSHLTVDQYVRLLTCIEDAGGIAALGDLALAMPDVRRPVSAVLDLCDAGILCCDFEASFDANMRVWRIDG